MYALHRHVHEQANAVHVRVCALVLSCCQGGLPVSSLHNPWHKSSSTSLSNDVTAVPVREETWDMGEVAGGWQMRSQSQGVGVIAPQRMRGRYSIIWTDAERSLP